MTGITPASTAGRATRVSAQSVSLPIILFGLAAVISGFTALRQLGPYDEGQILLAAQRVAAGHLPYSDFVFPYGPGHPLLLAGMQSLLGRSLLWWRLIRVGADASVAVMVFVIVRREAPLRVALLAWLIAETGMAQPGGPNPFPVALAFGLAAFAVATAVAPGEWRGRLQGWLGAGALVAAAAFWRLDFGVYAGGAVFVALLAAPSALSIRVRVAVQFAASAILATVILYSPFIAAAGPGRLYRQLVGEGIKDAGYFTLPFPWPWRFHGPFALSPPGALAKDLKKFVDFNVPGLLLTGLVLIAAAIIMRSRRAERPWRWIGLLVYGLGCLLYMRSRADDFHAQPLLVIVVVGLAASGAWLLAELRGRAGGSASREAGLAARPTDGETGRASASSARSKPQLELAVALGLVSVVVLLLGAHGIANRLSALLRPPDLVALDLPGTSGVTDNPRDVRALRQVVPYVQARVPSSQPIFVAPKRSDLVDLDNLIFYVLVDRNSVLDAGATLEALPRQQRVTVIALERHRPRIVVRWLSALSDHAEPNLRGRSTGSHILDDYLLRAYHATARFGDYQVLERR